jgi:hypothetical protein
MRNLLSSLCFLILVGDGSALVALQSTWLDTPQVISVGEVATGTFQPQIVSWAGTVSPGVYDMFFELTAPSEGTLIVHLDWDPNLGGVFLQLEDEVFDYWPPIVGSLQVTAGRTYRVRVGYGGWDLIDFLPFVLTTSLQPGQVVVPAGCIDPPPGFNWVCVDGGWVPPDHPLAALNPPSAPVPPPESPAPPTEPVGCPTVQPGPSWVCVNGGWLPPDHPLAASAPPSSAPPAPQSTGGCTTPDPFAGIAGLVGVCVNGGWVPLGHPLAGGGG